MPKDIRPLYDTYGVDGYYRDHAAGYENPHFPEIKTLLERLAPRLDTSHILDFGAGGGEVTRVLQSLGISNITGCDPYTYDLYTRNTGRPCLRLAFMDVIRNGLPANYSAIISSFALHLCPAKDLFSLSWQLLEAAPIVLVLTPHKRPELEQLPGIRLAWEDFALTARGKKVRARAYVR